MDDQFQTRAAALKGLAQAAKFGTLSEAENLLLEKVPSGKEAKCPDPGRNGYDPKDAGKWGSQREIRAELVAWLCTDEQARKHVPWRGIQVFGADVSGALDLSFVNIPFRLAFRHCRLKERIDLGWAEVSYLNLEGSWVGGISADGVIVKSDVILGKGFTAVGKVGFKGAQIGGDLDFDGGAFTNPAKKDDPESVTALGADEINVTGSVFLRNGFSANGEVRLTRAQIGGNLECDGGTFRNKGGRSLNAAGINVKGHVFLRRDPNPEKNAEGKEIPFMAEGEVNLVTACVDGQLDCSGGLFCNPTGQGLSADRLIVKSSVYLNDGFTANGTLKLSGVQVGGTFDCSGGNFQKATLDLTDATAGTLVDSGLGDIPPGAPADSPPTVWPQLGNLCLDGFTYARISSRGRINVHKRIDWLGLQPPSPFRPRPHLQLAKIIRESGDSRGALRVLERMEDLRRKDEERGRFAQLWTLILKWTIGYGYDPKRAIWALAFLTVMGGVLYCGGYFAKMMVPTEKGAYAELASRNSLPPHYPRFSASIYSLENSLPLIKLGQADKWQPNPATPVLVWFLRIQILLGWVLATFFVAGISGIVHKE